MSLVTGWFSGNFISAMGWTVVHSLWQGVLIAVVLSLLLTFTDRAKNNLRYRFAMSALILQFMLSLLTFRFIFSPPDNPIVFGTTQTMSINPTMVQLSTPNDFLNSNTLEMINGFLNANINLIFGVWLLGFFFFSLRFIGGLTYTQRYKRIGVSSIPEMWEKKIQELSKKIEIQKIIHTYESTLVKIPIVVGHFKPMILLPVGMLAGLPANQIEAIIIHELAHIKRADFIINIFQSVLEVIFFFHPAVWWFSSIIRKEREFICDEITIGATGNPAVYAKALLNMTEHATIKFGLAMPLLNNSKQLIRRIKKMLGENKKSNMRGRYFPAIILSIILVTFFFCYPAKSKSSRAVSKNNVPVKINAASVLSMDELSAFFDKASQDSTSCKREKTLAFTETENGEDVDYEVNFRGEDIVSLYRNGAKVLDNQIDDYSDMIYEKVDELRGRYHHLKFDMHDFKVNMNEFKKNMQELREELSKENYHVDFDKDEFKKEMEQLKEELKQLDNEKIRIHFDSEEFKEQMHQLKEELKSMKFKHHFNITIPDVDIDIPEIDIDIPEINIDFPEIDIDIPEIHIPEINIDMSEFERDMKKFDEEMKDFSVEMEKFGKFMEWMKDELVKDGYIKDNDDDIELEFNSEKMVVNGKRLPDDKLVKYKKLYREITGKEISEDNCIKINH
ncbi:MAG: M56 family metallopeptidase [bacterium]